MRKINLLAAFILLSLLADRLSAQSVEYIDANNVRSGYMPGATLFMTDSNVYNSYEVPKGSGIKSIFASNFWVSGLDAGNNLKEAASEYYNQGYTYGPVASNYNHTYDSVYKKVYKVTRTEINNHIANYSSTGYVTPADIAQWPGNGNTSNGEAAILAPFVDLNSNGVYEPALGEYPDVTGDQAVFMMMNDARPGINSCSPMYIELHVLAYAFAASVDSPLGNTTFLSVRLFNRSGIPYHGVYFSNFVDNDLGCANNDRVGSDTSGNYFYVYNGEVQGSSFDGGTVCPTGEIGYGNQKVAQATVFLNKKMSSFVFFSNGAPTAMSDPSNCTGYRNLQTGLWNDGTPFTYGGNGYGGSSSTPYLFPGDPTDPSQWSEVNQQSGPAIAAGDRRASASVLVDTLLAGQSANIDIAYVTAFADSTAPALSELTKLRQAAHDVRQLYAQGGISAPTSITNVQANTSYLHIYPNPSSGVVTVEATEKLTQISVTDMQGRELVSRAQINDKQVVVDLSAVSKGVYVIHTKTVSGSEDTKKIIIK